jgi:hypothetical protein
LQLDGFEEVGFGNLNICHCQDTGAAKPKVRPALACVTLLLPFQ